MELIQINFECNSNFNLCNATLITCTSEVYHTHGHMIYQEQTLAIGTWLISITYGVEFAFQMQWTSFKLNVPQTIPSHHGQLHHVLENCTLSVAPFLLMFVPVTVPPRR